ncbi:hypothetical protein NON00_23350, partial [Roseomonas sp. GC11]|uniref:hypothetical protein n=1 Tax=Roseomonas sp. GC11 TaxID=2950546 RepID=UPI00210A69B6
DRPIIPRHPLPRSHRRLDQALTGLRIFSFLLFLKKKKLSFSLASRLRPEAGRELKKVFWFFFSKKNVFL